MIKQIYDYMLKEIHNDTYVCVYIYIYIYCNVLHLKHIITYHIIRGVEKR